jgi:hypothetical protein
MDVKENSENAKAWTLDPVCSLPAEHRAVS